MIHATSLHSSQLEKAKNYLKGWQRARAELANFQKNQQNQQAKNQQVAKQQVIGELLIIADNFQALYNHIPNDLAENPWTIGVAHVAKQFEQTLKDYGLVPVGKINEQFDPHRHEAIQTVKNKNHKTDTIVEIVQTGYQLDEAIIRPAKVKVAA